MWTHTTHISLGYTTKKKIRLTQSLKKDGVGMDGSI